QAAALLIGAAPGGSEYTPSLDLRVDDHPEPIGELLRLCGLMLPGTPLLPGTPYLFQK
ncbi:MAG: hypothetical protein HYU66_00485, partial [Armatimonadetes bacterium]|nr:hypothetical protein [Armatimonadota bacterium]